MTASNVMLAIGWLFKSYQLVWLVVVISITVWKTHIKTIIEFVYKVQAMKYKRVMDSMPIAS